MSRVGQVGVAVVVGLWALSATAGESWRTVMEEPLLIKTHDVPGSGVHEYLVEGVVNASVVDLQATLSDPEKFSSFMPHVTESRLLQRDGNTDRVYTKIEPPLGGPRDYVTEVVLVEAVHADGTGTFRQSWHALPDALPERNGVTRVKVNEGSWEIVANDNGGSKVIYRFQVDPGGWVPDFIAELANKKAIPATIRAIEREAQRRGQLRRQTAQMREPAPQMP